jgi:hypothetical protein
VAGILPGDGGGAETPEFAFETTKVLAVPTRPDAQPSTLHETAEPVAAGIAEAMDVLYIEAFLDPDNWQDGSYDDVWTLFEPGAAAEAEASVDTLTAGTGAGEAYDSIQPNVGLLRVKVLLDKQDRPFSALALVKFTAIGAGKDGDEVLIDSRGQFIFGQVDEEWRIVSFRVLRDDESREPPISASPSAEPS